MPAPAWIISAHGYFDNRNGMFEVPPGKTVHFWTMPNSTLYNEIAWPLLWELVSGNLLAGSSVACGGAQLYNYTAYGTTDFPSGVFVPGSTQSVYPIWPPPYAWQLSDILAMPDCPPIVYWLCCTEFVAPSNYGSGGPAPGPTPGPSQMPPRFP